jgi:hypothetical protein
MLNLLREVGMPSVLVGAMKHAMRGISEEQVKDMCARVGVGMFHIYTGGDVRESLHPSALNDDTVVARMVGALKGVPALPIESEDYAVPDVLELEAAEEAT